MLIYYTVWNIESVTLHGNESEGIEQITKNVFLAKTILVFAMSNRVFSSNEVCHEISISQLPASTVSSYYDVSNLQYITTSITHCILVNSVPNGYCVITVLNMQFHEKLLNGTSWDSHRVDRKVIEL